MLGAGWLSERGYIDGLWGRGGGGVSDVAMNVQLECDRWISGAFAVLAAAALTECRCVAVPCSAVPSPITL